MIDHSIYTLMNDRQTMRNWLQSWGACTTLQRWGVICPCSHNEKQLRLLQIPTCNFMWGNLILISESLRANKNTTFNKKSTLLVLNCIGGDLSVVHQIPMPNTSFSDKSFTLKIRIICELTMPSRQNSLYERVRW